MQQLHTILFIESDFVINSKNEIYNYIDCGDCPLARAIKRHFKMTDDMMIMIDGSRNDPHQKIGHIEYKDEDISIKNIFLNNNIWGYEMAEEYYEQIKQGETPTLNIRIE